MWRYKHKDTDKDHLSLCNYRLKSNVGMVNTMGKLNDRVERFLLSYDVQTL